MQHDAHHRDLGPYQGQLTQADLVYMTGQTELGFNEEVRRVHLGEDGPSLNVIFTRQFHIQDQMWYSGELRDWYLDECWAGMEFED